MITTTIRPHIPKSERALSEAKYGELVKISVPDDWSINGYKQHWVIFIGNENGKDRFIMQDKAKNKEDVDLVMIYESQRNTHGYDERLGVILDSIGSNVRFVSPQREEYSKLVKLLKKAEEWI